MGSQGAVTSSKVIRFQDYEVDLRAGRLHKSGIRIGLREKSFQVLAALLEQPGEVVTREALRQRLWPNDVFVDFENNLNTAVARLRVALNDSAENPRYIETLPKRGYRFVGSLSKPIAPRLLVLPFANLSGDPAQDYLSDALTEELITGLASVAPKDLAVIARTTAMHYKNSRKDIAAIGADLAVEYAVEGSLHRVDGRIGVNVQLVRVSDQVHLWANRYDTEWRDLLSTAGEAANAIAAQIGISPQRTTKATKTDPEAYRQYMRGRDELAKLTSEGIATAQQCFEAAIARDPKFALPYDGIAELHWYLGFVGIMPPRQASSTGVLAAMRALELDDTLAETHALLGWFRKELDYDWPEVHREMKRALDLNPTSPVVRFRYAKGELCPHGRIQEAIVEIEAALESDPLSLDMRHWLGEMRWLGRQYDRAIEEVQKALNLDSEYLPAHFGMGLFLREKRLFDQSIRAHRKAVELSRGAPVMLGWFGLALAQGGKRAEAQSLLKQLDEIARTAYVPPTSFAWIYFGLGDVDNAFVWLDRAIDARDHMMTPIKTYPFLDPVRSDPRYLSLLRRMNLEP